MNIKELKKLGIPDFVIENFKKQDITKLYPAQIKAIKKGVLDGKNMLICTPTSSGKTAIATFAITKKLTENKESKAVYLVPLKALANEKYKDYKELFKGTGFEVVISTGDLDSRSEWLDRYDLLILTVEKMDSLIRHSCPWLSSVATVIVDECLPYNTLVLLSDNSLIKIGELVESVSKENMIKRKRGYYYPSKGSNRVLSYNIQKSYFEPRKIIGYWKLRAPKHYCVIKTDDGNKIKVTENHPLLTNNGSVRWVYAKNLKKGMCVAIKKGIDFEEKGSDKIIIDRKDLICIFNNKQKYYANSYLKVLKIRNKTGFGARIISRKIKVKEGTVRAWINKPRKVPKSIKVIRRLENKGLLPLKENDPRLSVICRIIGHIFGDGWIYRKGRAIGFSGEYSDLQSIKKDLSSLGFKSGKIFKRNTKSRINTIKGDFYSLKGTTTSFNSGDSSLLYLLLALGVPYGNKTNKEFCIPKWIMEAPLSLKKGFLSAWMGSEGPEINSPKNSRRIEAIRVRFNKIEKLKNNGLFFANQIKKLFSDFNVNISQIVVKKANIRKDGSKSIQISLTIGNSDKNIMRFVKNIDCAYCIRKEKKANFVLEYLLEKQDRIKKLKEIREKVMFLRKKEKVGPKNIVKKLNLPDYFLNTMQNWIYHGRNTKLSTNFPTFQEWIKTQNPNNSINWGKIISVKKVECQDKYVYDIEVEKTHNFIADNIIVRNCHLLNDPGRGPTVEILITILRQLLKKVQIIALSATVGNPDELAEWLNASLVIDNWRPVKLHKGIYFNGEIEFRK